MICPICGSEIQDNKCNYCGYNLSEGEKQDSYAASGSGAAQPVDDSIYSAPRGSIDNTGRIVALVFTVICTFMFPIIALIIAAVQRTKPEDDMSTVFNVFFYINLIFVILTVVITVFVIIAAIACAMYT